MKFDEFIEKITNPGEDGLDESVINEFKTEYERAITIADTHESKVTELETANRQQAETITGLKTELYDASRKLPNNNDLGERHEVESNKTEQVVTVTDIGKRLAGGHKW